jgi:uncharacterized protein involved in outer membrane biogenesis
MIYSIAVSLLVLMSAGPRSPVYRSGAQSQGDSTCVRRDTTTRFAPAPQPREDTTAWSSAFKRSVRARQACVGMSADMLRMAWGLPATIDQQTTGNQVSEQFMYPHYVVALQNAQVVAIRPRGPVKQQ